MWNRGGQGCWGAASALVDGQSIHTLAEVPGQPPHSAGGTGWQHSAQVQQQVHSSWRGCWRQFASWH